MVEAVEIFTCKDRNQEVLCPILNIKYSCNISQENTLVSSSFRAEFYSEPNRLYVKKSCARTSALNRLWRQNILSSIIFSAKTFPRKNTNGKKSLRLSVLTAKFLKAKVPMEKFLKPKISHSENSSRQSVLTTKCTYGSVSQRQKNPYGNVSRGKIFFTGKTSTAKFPTAKSPTTKSPCSKVFHAEIFYDEKYHAEISGYVRTHRQLQH